MSRSSKIRALLIALACWLLLCALYLLPAARESTQKLEVLSRVWHFQLRGERAPGDILRVVGITQDSISLLSQYGDNYPFPRDLHALALRRLADAGARAVVMDIMFSEEGSWSEAEDAALRDAIMYCRERGCEVVLATGIEATIYGGGVKSESEITLAAIVLEAQPILGLSNTQHKLSYKLTEQISQSLPLGEGGADKVFFTQAAAAAQLAGKSLPPVRGFAINYSGPPRNWPVPPASFETLLPELDIESPGLWEEAKALREQRADEGALSGYDATRLEELQTLRAEQLAPLSAKFKDRIVFLGSRNAGDNDYFETPFGQMFGVDTNAQAFDTLYRGAFITEAGALALPLALLLALAGWALSLLRPFMKGALAGLLLLAALIAANALLFTLASVDLSLLLTAAGFALPFSASMIYGGVTEERAKQQVRSAFSRYVAPELVARVLKDPALARIGTGERRMAVILFNDIRSYSTISERMPPVEVVEMLNIYFGEAAEIIRQHGGSVNAYLGDGLMASFGAIVPLGAPASSAMRACLEIIAALHDRVHPRLAEKGVAPFKVGLGLHYGEGVAGNIGSASRFDFSFIGDTTNLASRVESTTKEYGQAILVTHEVIEQAAAEGFSFATERVGEARVKGREQPVEFFRLYDPGREELYRL